MEIIIFNLIITAPHLDPSDPEFPERSLHLMTGALVVPRVGDHLHQQGVIVRGDHTWKQQRNITT